MVASEHENPDSPPPEGRSRWEHTTEEEFLTVVKDVGNVLAGKMVFGYHTSEDVRQMVAVLALEALPRYRPEMGTLGGFLFRHCPNRILNIRRDQLGWRKDAPCKTCHRSALGQGPSHEDGSVCPRFETWWARSQARAAVQRLLSLDLTTEDYAQARSESVAQEQAESNELEELIDRELPPGLRGDYLRLRDGVTLPEHRRKAVQCAVSSILGGQGAAASPDG